MWDTDGYKGFHMPLKACMYRKKGDDAFFHPAELNAVQRNAAKGGLCLQQPLNLVVVASSGKSDHGEEPTKPFVLRLFASDGDEQNRPLVVLFGGGRR